MDRLKEAARDQGVIPDLVRLCADHPDSIYYIASVHSLAAAPALHIALREADAVGSLARVLAATQLEVVIICALIAVAHLCAGEHGSGAADGEALLAK